MVPLLRRGTGPRISWWGALVVLWWWLSAIASFLLLQAAADSLTDLDGSCYVEPSEETVCWPVLSVPAFIHAHESCDLSGPRAYTGLHLLAVVRLCSYTHLQLS